jgi:hypothetical protein
MQQRVDEELGDASDFEEGAPVVGGRGHEGHAGTGESHSFRHGAMLGVGGKGVNPTNGVVLA